MGRKNKVAEIEEKLDDRTAGILYNALYMLDWQIGRARAGIWDEKTADLLDMGAATAARLVVSGQSFGKYTPRIIRQLRDDAWALIDERHKIA